MSSATSDSVRRDALRVIMGAFEGEAIPEWLPALVDDGLGGICLYGNNLGDSSESVLDLARRVGALSDGLVLTLDEEGGDVTRLHYGHGSPYPGNAVLGRHDDVETTAQVARGIGEELKSGGIWLDLAPDADVNSNPRNPVIGTRSFGADPALVARHTAAWVTGLQAAGVAACVKHFPGHGDTEADSHLALPRVDADAATLRERELVPFTAAARAGAAAVMTSHIVLPALDAENPATMSRAVLTGLLRDELAYEGLIVTDALDMAGASATIGVPAAAVRALAAGADLLCIGPNLRGRGVEDIVDVVDAIVAAVDDGSLARDRLRDAAARVDALAATYGTGARAADADVVAAGLAAGEVAAAAVQDALGPLPQGTPRVLQVRAHANLAVGEAAWGDLGLEGVVPRVVDADTLPAADELAAGDGPLVVVTRGATNVALVWDWLRAVTERRPDAVVVETAWPSPDLHALPRVLRTWGSSVTATRAAGHVIAEALAGAVDTTGAHR